MTTFEKTRTPLFLLNDIINSKLYNFFFILAHTNQDDLLWLHHFTIGLPTCMMQNFRNSGSKLKFLLSIFKRIVSNIIESSFLIIIK